MSGRSTYREISRDLLSTYLTGCTSRGFGGESPQAVCSWAYCEYDGAYDLPVERLMLQVTALALTGGWYPSIEQAIRSEMESILSEHSIHDLLASISYDEAEELVRNLQVLLVLDDRFEFAHRGRSL